MNEERRKDVYDMLTIQATTFIKSRHYSKVKVTGVRAFLEFLEMTYNVSRVALNVGSLIISLDCKTLRGLDQLWNDYLSGYLYKLSERHLVTDEMKKKLNLRTIKLKIAIEEENYLKCKKILVACSGECKCFMYTGLTLPLDFQVSSRYQTSVVITVILMNAKAG